MASDSAEKWNVVIESSTTEEVKAYRLPLTTTIADVLGRWHADAGVEGRWQLRKINGQLLAADLMLQEAGELVVGSRTITLVAEKVLLLRCRIYKAANQSAVWHEIGSDLSLHPAEMHAAVREAFCLSEDRVFRLRGGAQTLNYDLTLAQQGVTEDSELQVELGVEVTLVLAEEKRRCLVFASESLAEAADGLGAGERVLLVRQVVDVNVPIGDALPNALWTSPRLKLHCERRQSVAVMSDGDIRQQDVWPNDSVRVLSRRRPRGRPLMLDGARVSKRATFKGAGVQSGAIFYREVCVTVRLSSGRCRVVRVPQCATVADLKEAVAGEEEDRNFTLHNDRRRLREEEVVDAAMGRAGVRVERAAHEVLVSLPDRSVRWTTDTPKMRRRELMLQLARRGGGEYADLEVMPLMCEGCGRRLSEEEEEFQLIPAPCCRVRSLRLKKPPTSSDVGTQARSWLFEEATRNRQPIFFFNDFAYSGCGNFTEDLPGEVTPGQLRTAASATLSLLASDLWLSRPMGVVDEDEVFGVVDPQRPDWLGFCDTAGNVFERADVHQIAWRHLDDDSAFPLASGWTNSVRVSPAPICVSPTPIRVSPAPIRTLTVHSEVNVAAGSLFPVDLPMCCGVTVGHVRTAVGQAIDADAEELWLSRPVTWVGGSQAFGVEEGGDMAFVSVQGQTWTIDEVEMWSWRELKSDSDHFPLVCGSNSLRLSPAPLRHVVVDNDFRDGPGGRVFSETIPLRPDGTVGELRLALARWMGLPESLLLSRPAGRFAGLEVFGVEDEKRPDWCGFRDVKGIVECGEEEVQDLEWRQMPDTAAFAMVPERMNQLRVSPAPLVSFFVINDARESDDRPSFFEDFPLAPGGRVGDLRAAVAWWMRIPPDEVWLDRPVVRDRERGLLVGVRNVRRPDWFGYSEVTGGVAAEVHEVVDRDWRIMEDEEEFVPMPGWTTVIRVASAPLRPFLVYNDIPGTPQGRIHNENLPLRDPVTVGDVRQIIAMRTDLPVQSVGISRRVGVTTVGGKKVDLFKVADDARIGWRGFSDEDGQIETGLETSSWEEQLQDDTKPFPVVRNRRNQVRVYRYPR